MTVAVGSAERLVNKRELARHLGTTVVTIGNWIERFGDEFPVHSRGTNGREWQFDLAECVEFLRQRKEEEARLEQERDATLAQLVLPLVANQPEIAPAHTPKLSIKEQIEAQRLSTLRRQELERLGRLVWAEDVKNALTESMAVLARTLRTAARSIGHDFNLPPQVVRAIETKLADAQRGFVRDAGAYLVPTLLDEEPPERAHG